MKQSDGWSKPYAASFAINQSCLRRSNAFDKSVSSIGPTDKGLSFSFIYTTQEKTYKTLQNLDKKKNLPRK